MERRTGPEEKNKTVQNTRMFLFEVGGSLPEIKTRAIYHALGLVNSMKI